MCFKRVNTKDIVFLQKSEMAYFNKCFSCFLSEFTVMEMKTFHFGKNKNIIMPDSKCSELVNTYATRTNIYDPKTVIRNTPDKNYCQYLFTLYVVDCFYL